MKPINDPHLMWGPIENIRVSQRLELEESKEAGYNPPVRSLRPTFQCMHMS